jgi:hypothetical protein
MRLTGNMLEAYQQQKLKAYSFEVLHSSNTTKLNSDNEKFKNDHSKAT